MTDVIATLLLPLLSRRARFAYAALLLFLLTPFVYGYAQLRDNNSILGMLDRDVEDYRYFLEEYLPGFGSGDDDTVYTIFETTNALADDAVAVTKATESTLLNTEIPIIIDPSTQELTTLVGTAQWPWAGVERDPGALGCFTPERYGVSYGQCLRRQVFPVDVEIKTNDNGSSWFIELPESGADGETADAHRIPVTCSENRVRCDLALVKASYSYVDLLRASPGASSRGRLDNMSRLLQLERDPELASPTITNTLLGGEYEDPDGARFTIISVTSRLVSLRSRDDLRSVGLSWIEHRLRQQEIGGVRYHILGAATMLAVNANEMATTHVTLEPLIIGLVFLLVAISFRDLLSFILVPICSLVAALVTTMGAYALSGGSYNWVFVILPTIIVVTSVSDSIHLIGFYRAQCGTCLTREAAFKSTLHAKLAPCFFSSLTTGLGLFSIYLFANSENFSNFGWFGALGVMSAFGYSFLLFALLAPSVEVVRRARRGASSPPTRRVGAADSSDTPKPYVTWLVGWRKPIVLFTMALVGASVIVTPKLELDFDYRRWYVEDTSISRAQSFVDERMSGSNFFPVVVSSDEREGEACATIPESLLPTARRERVCLTDAQVSAIWGIRDRLRASPETGERDTISGEASAWSEANTSVLDMAFVTRGQSAATVMGEVQCYLDGGLPRLTREGIACAAAPPSAERDARRRLAAEQLRMHFNLSTEDAALRGRQTQVRVLARQGNGADFQQYLRAIKRDLDERVCPLSSGCRAIITGFSHVCTKFFGDVLSEMEWSFAFAVLTCCLIMFVVLSEHPWLALLSVVPNTIPFLLMGGVMLIAGISLHFITMMIAAVAMGIIVDDTIQFCHALSRRLDDHRARATGARDDAVVFRRAISDAIDSTGYAMVITSVSLAIGFSLLMMSDFQNTYDVGVLLVIVIITALLSDLVVFPALLLWLADSRRFLTLVFRVRDR